MYTAKKPNNTEYVQKAQIMEYFLTWCLTPLYKLKNAIIYLYYFTDYYFIKFSIKNMEIVVKSQRKRLWL